MSSVFSWLTYYDWQLWQDYGSGTFEADHDDLTFARNNGRTINSSYLRNHESTYLNNVSESAELFGFKATPVG